MNRTDPRITLAAALTVFLLVVGSILAVFGATSAQAHTGAVTGTAICEDDGTYTVQWTYNATNVPDGKEAETKAMTTSAGILTTGPDGVNKGGQVFLSVWSEHQVNVPGAPVRTGNWSAVFRTVGIPSGTSSVSTMVQTDWKGGPSEDPVGEVDLPDGCGVPSETPAPSPTVPTGTPSETLSPSPSGPTSTPTNPSPTPTPTAPTGTPTAPSPTTTPPTTPPTTVPPTTPPTTAPPVRASSRCVGNALVTRTQEYRDGEWETVSTSYDQGAARCRTRTGEPPVIEEGY